jgi:chromosome segregation ATPase
LILFEKEKKPMTLRDRVAALEEGHSATAPNHDWVRFQLEQIKLLQRPEPVDNLDRRMTALEQRSAEIQAKDAEVTARHQQHEDALELKAQQLEERENALVKRQTEHEVAHDARAKRVAETEAAAQTKLDAANKLKAEYERRLRAMEGAA